MPGKFHRMLKSRAASEGLSVSEFLNEESVAERPTMKELGERIARLPAVKLKRSPAEIIREERDRRSAKLMELHLGRQTPGLGPDEDH
jgi:hypothetical protein